MNNEHHEVFIRESEEQITELNNALLALESEPGDESAMDAIFRTAHTLKGNAGAMGFSGISGLAHAIEDLLDEIRDGNIAVGPDVMDLVFEGVDRIDLMLEELEAEGETQSDPAALEADIRDLVASRADGDDGAATEGDSPAQAPAGESDAATRARAVLDDDPPSGDVLYGDIRVGDTSMRGVDGMLVLETLRGEWEVLGTDPGREAIEDGEYEDGFDVFVAGDDPDALADLLSGSSKVADATVTDVSEAFAGDRDVDGNGTEAAVVDETGDAPPERADRGAVTADATESDAGRSRSMSVDDIKSVRVDVGRLDDLHGLVEQLVTSRIKLRRAVEEGQGGDALDNLDELDKITTHLQDTVMDMRLIPLKKVVSKFPRLVRDLARTEGKEVAFSIEGEDIELDRTILTQISDPLMHILRNAVDHGIESPTARETAGKPREGRIELRATRERDHVIIEVEDDGQGLDVDAIREKAVENDVLSTTELEAMEDSDVYDLVFHPGFSTSEEVTDVSGRGVGMDVVHSTVKQLDGSVNVQSDPGAGTTVRLRLPVTVAIVTVLFVLVDGERYGIPIKAIDEISRVTDLRTINGREVVEHDDDIYPVIRLADSLDVALAQADGGTQASTPAADAASTAAATGQHATEQHDDTGQHDTTGHNENGQHETGQHETTAGHDGMLLRIRKSERQVALHCDAVEDQEEVVVKPLEGVLSGIPGLSGTAVLGDGNIVPILDVVTL